MDSNDLERERGITILSKCTSVFYTGSSAEPHLIDIVDLSSTRLATRPLAVRSSTY
jgi:predicted membrane GTPase involved in stress response